MSAVRTYENSERPDGWRKVRLGDVVEINQRNWDPRDGAPILYLDLTAVIAPGRLDEPKELAASDAPSRARRRVLSGDILVSTVRPNLRGFARVQKAAGNLVASTGFAVLTPSTEVEGSFVYHHVMTEQFAARLEAAATGQAYPAVRPDDVNNYSITLPPLPEQRAIADVLDSIDEAIERTEAVIAATETLRDALLHELLTRGVPGWHTEWKDVPGIGTIPANWDVVRLGEVATVRNGTTPSRKHEPYWDNGDVPFVKTGRVNDVFIREPDEFITLQAVMNAGAVMVPEGSILIAMIGQGKTRGMTARLGFSAAINQNFAAVYEPSLGFDLDYFFSWASHNYVRIRGLGQGSNQDALNCELIQRMQFPVPPISEQQVIVGLLEGVAKSFAEAKKEQGSLQSLKHSTADTLLTGRTRLENRNE